VCVCVCVCARAGASSGLKSMPNKIPTCKQSNWLARISDCIGSEKEIEERPSVPTNHFVLNSTKMFPLRFTCISKMCYCTDFHYSRLKLC
jgi:hypothetical protein